MIDDLHCLQCRVPVDVVIARNHYYSRPVSIQKAFDEFVKKFLGYGILFCQFSLVIDHSKRHALNKVATYHDRFGGKHPGIFAEIALSIADESRDQLIIRDRVSRWP